MILASGGRSHFFWVRVYDISCIFISMNALSSLLFLIKLHKSVEFFSCLYWVFPGWTRSFAHQMRPGIITVGLRTHVHQSLPFFRLTLELVGDLRTCIANKCQDNSCACRKPRTSALVSSLKQGAHQTGAWSPENPVPRLCGLELPSLTYFLKYRGICILV